MLKNLAGNKKSEDGVITFIFQWRFKKFDVTGAGGVHGDINTIRACFMELSERGCSVGGGGSRSTTSLHPPPPSYDTKHACPEPVVTGVHL